MNAKQWQCEMSEIKLWLKTGVFSFSQFIESDSDFDVHHHLFSWAESNHYYEVISGLHSNVL